MKPSSRRSAPFPDRSAPRLTFSPLAWLKLQYLCHAGETEVGGFGIAALDDPLYVEAFATMPQQASPVSARFLDEAVADFFDQCVDRGLSPQRFSRVWAHTHPGDSPEPSCTDEETFARCFGSCDWSVMFILSRTGRTYARLAFSAGPGGELLIPTAIDWSRWPDLVDGAGDCLAAHLAEWRREYAAHVRAAPLLQPLLTGNGNGLDAEDWWEGWPFHPDLDDIRYQLVEEVNPPHGPTDRFTTP